MELCCFNSLLRTSHQLLVMQQLAVALAATGPAHGTGTESHSLITPRFDHLKCGLLLH